MNDKPKIIEYIDLPKEMSEELDENGELMYGEVNIGTYLYNRSVLENLANAKLPYHAAFKKSGYLNIDRQFIEPEAPNVFKFETFIFDAFTRYDNMTIMRVKREDEFAPVKIVQEMTAQKQLLNYIMKNINKGESLLWKM